LRKKRETILAGINTKEIDDENRNERQAKGSTHFRLTAIDFFSAVL
jgi:hypothetical protein